MGDGALDGDVQVALRVPEFLVGLDQARFEHRIHARQIGRFHRRRRVGDPVVPRERPRIDRDGAALVERAERRPRSERPDVPGRRRAVRHVLDRHHERPDEAVGGQPHRQRRARRELAQQFADERIGQHERRQLDGLDGRPERLPRLCLRRGRRLGGLFGRRRRTRPPRQDHARHDGGDGQQECGNPYRRARTPVGFLSRRRLRIGAKAEIVQPVHDALLFPCYLNPKRALMSYSFAMRRLLLVSLAVLVLVAAAGAAPPAPVVTNVIVITLDGMRWQELFGGAERSLLGKDEKEITGSSSYRRFWRETPEDRRAALMPYLLDRRGEAGPGVRRPLARQPVARHQRPLVLVPRLCRDARRRGGSAGSTATTRSPIRT